MTLIKERYSQPFIIKSCVKILLETIVLTCVLKNVNISNDSRVSTRDVKSFSSQYVLDGSIQNTCISCIII